MMFAIPDGISNILFFKYEPSTVTGRYQQILNDARLMLTSSSSSSSSSSSECHFLPHPRETHSFHGSEMFCHACSTSPHNSNSVFWQRQNITGMKLVQWICAVSAGTDLCQKVRKLTSDTPDLATAIGSTRNSFVEDVIWTDPEWFQAQAAARFLASRWLHRLRTHSPHVQPWDSICEIEQLFLAKVLPHLSCAWIEYSVVYPIILVSFHKGSIDPFICASAWGNNTVPTNVVSQTLDLTGLSTSLSQGTERRVPTFLGQDIGLTLLRKMLICTDHPIGTTHTHMQQCIVQVLLDILISSLQACPVSHRQARACPVDHLWGNGLTKDNQTLFASCVPDLASGILHTNARSACFENLQWFTAQGGLGMQGISQMHTSRFTSFRHQKVGHMLTNGSCRTFDMCFFPRPLHFSSAHFITWSFRPNRSLGFYRIPAPQAGWLWAAGIDEKEWPLLMEIRKLMAPKQVPKMPVEVEVQVQHPASVFGYDVMHVWVWSYVWLDVMCMFRLFRRYSKVSRSMSIKSVGNGWYQDLQWFTWIRKLTAL